jgi:hypothetical protein
LKSIKKTKNQLLRELTLLKRKNKALNDSVKQNEKYLELIKQNAQKDLVFWEKVPDMVPMFLFMNIPGKNWWVNAHAEKVLGISPKELSSYDVDTFFSFFHLDDLPKVRTIAAEEILKGKTVLLEIRLRDNKGNWKRFYTTISPLEYPGESDVSNIIGTVINFVQNEILINLYRIPQEALNNIEKHSFAKNVTLSFSFKKHVLNVKITDDGKGFDSSSIIKKYDDNNFGLKNIKERVNFYKGSMDINSYPGSWTEIVIRIPY